MAKVITRIHVVSYFSPPAPPPKLKKKLKGKQIIWLARLGAGMELSSAADINFHKSHYCCLSHFLVTHLYLPSYPSLVV